MSIPSHWPERPRLALAALLRGLESHLPAPESLTVFGSLVAGGWRDGTSNVNLAVVLNDTSVAELRRLGPIFRGARMQSGISPLILGASEIAPAADAFPLKFAHIKAHHHVIFGADPFATLTIDAERLRARTEAELRNQLIRLRQAVMFAGDDALAAARVLQSAAKPFAMELEAALFVAGHPMPFEADVPTVLHAAARRFPALDGSFLEILSAIATGGRVDAPGASLARLPEQLGVALDVIASLGATR